MSEVHTQIQLEVDHAHSFHGAFAGLKLDKSKCFDRLLPKLCAVLMLALGLPAHLCSGFCCTLQSDDQVFVLQAVDMVNTHFCPQRSGPRVLCEPLVH